MRKIVLFVCISVVSGLFSTHLLAQTPKIHIVEPGETMYGISKMLKIHITDLQKANPQIINNAIQIGDTLQIPANVKDIKITSQPIEKKPSKAHPFGGVTVSDQMNASPAKTPPAETNFSSGGVQNNQFPMIKHVVESKQTLYAISKLYNVSVEDIKAWNHLADNSIKEGSILFIRAKTSGKESHPNIVETKESPKENVAVEEAEKATGKVVKSTVAEVETPKLPEPVTEATVPKNKNAQAQLEDVFIAEKSKGKSLLTSRGTITWINTENPKMADSYFALHKTAPVGTVIRVTNLVNKRVVFVKVIGKLPETSDNINVTLRLSSAAKKVLLLNGDKAYVDMEYYQ